MALEHLFGYYIQAFFSIVLSGLTLAFVFLAWFRRRETGFLVLVGAAAVAFVSNLAFRVLFSPPMMSAMETSMRTTLSAILSPLAFISGLLAVIGWAVVALRSPRQPPFPGSPS